jgi:hypothetical protein
MELICMSFLKNSIKNLYGPTDLDSNFDHNQNYHDLDLNHAESDYPDEEFDNLTRQIYESRNQ